MSLFDLDVIEVLDRGAPGANPTTPPAPGEAAGRDNPAATPSCTFCDAPVYLDDATEHPCCGFARAAGHTRCEGCTNFANRQIEGRA